MDELIADIKTNLNIINKNLKDVDDELIDLAILLTLERIKLYLGCDDVPTRLVLITTEIVNSVIKKLKKSIELSNNVDVAISSISDNGQSISYANTVTNYFNTASDNEIFGGFTTVLSRYRRIKVV